LDQKLRQARQDIQDALDLGFKRISARLLLASKDGEPEQWRLLGICVGRLKTEMEAYFDGIADAALLEQIAGVLLFEPMVEAQIKIAYLFAKEHTHARFSEERLAEQMRLLEDSILFQPR
jgi:hypothetical protein